MTKKWFYSHWAT